VSYGLSRGKTLDVTGWGIDRSELPSFDAGPVDPRLWFPHPERPLEVEIGSGKGTFLLQEGQARPGVNLLGIEWAKEFWRYAADRLRRHGLPNVRLLHDDAAQFLRFRVPDGILSAIHLYFSDPWPKSRHHKRRVIQDESLRDFHRLLLPGAPLHLVTDHDELWAWYEEHESRHRDLFERQPFSPPASAGEREVVGSNFERKYQREGRPFRAMTLVRVGNPV